MVAKISHGMRLGCALLESIAIRRGHKRSGLRYNPAMASISTSASFGRRATCTETYRNPFVRMACEYGPMGFGPRSVRMTSLMVQSPLQIGPSSRQFPGSAGEIHQVRQASIQHMTECAAKNAV